MKHWTLFKLNSKCTLGSMQRALLIYRESGRVLYAADSDEHCATDPMAATSNKIQESDDGISGLVSFSR